MVIRNKRHRIIFLISGGILLIPLIAMQFTDEVQWNIADFLIAGGLLSGAGLACEMVLRKYKNNLLKPILIGIILMILILIWIELAVGIFGTPLGGN
ncbi:MAG: hypothetical protein D6714_06425 [Bacteroidetes bacterium]|nr:MAG: hypothetical protein D6714_06425 [Bacteroidota bacterium]